MKRIFFLPLYFCSQLVHSVKGIKLQMEQDWAHRAVGVDSHLHLGGSEG